MLLTLKEDCIPCNFYLWYLLCMLSVDIKSGDLFTSVHLYKIIMHNDGMTVTDTFYAYYWLIHVQ